MNKLKERIVTFLVDTGMLKRIGAIYCDVYGVSLRNYEDILRKGYRFSYEFETYKSKETMDEYVDRMMISDSGKKVLPRITFSIGSVCTLNCKFCSEFIPYFNKKKLISYEQVNLEIDRILEVVDKLVVAELIGGEPFLHPRIDEIIEKLCNSDKVRFVEITTNAKVPFQQRWIHALRNPKVRINISDYDSNNKEEVQCYSKIFEDNNIWYRFYTSEEMKWVDCGQLEKEERTEVQNSFCYLTCDCSALCRTIYDGKIYVCASAPVMFANGLLKTDNSYLDLSNISDFDDIKKFFERTNSEACDFCKMNNYHPRVLTNKERGVQIDQNCR